MYKNIFTKAKEIQDKKTNSTEAIDKTEKRKGDEKERERKDNMGESSENAIEEKVFFID